MLTAAYAFIIFITLLGLLSIPVSISRRQTTPGAGALSIVFSILVGLSATYLYLN